jgi:hypothetical protein
MREAPVFCAYLRIGFRRAITIAGLSFLLGQSEGGELDRAQGIGRYSSRCVRQGTRGQVLAYCFTIAPS